ncbi:hypothetical protein Ddye_031360 [Dipteronia dyeriana]|uniref:Poor homologous synapsis 1 PH domain-containing protein n=1 Tax=Dipteronia dyeriana TaxID=168575 RepID=A0AAD9TIQ4_9ROSI|nr:hypothetical protein Ddye_031360 [Dipteronia dyeriana]
MLHEEHYISKLHFSWTQMLCVSGFCMQGPVKCFSCFQIQKFALQFPTIYEAETFVNALNETLMDNGEPTPLNKLMRRNQVLWLLDTYIPDLPPSFNYEVEQVSSTQETKLNRNFEGVSPSLPPSFASLLANCYSEVKPGVAAAQPTVPEEVDLKSQIVRYMEDSSFHDMLFKVDRIMEEMGGDLKL